ncbi:hypothetical protein ACFO1B_22575 [Dactylosporangium siamense]|uniref:Uncharacterized protein n=1 Tax=Dactylosporangium siamense TaxID=685454 RepID=A0A919PTZ9_9ACTN|nr:hypothetical protein [Dactylosporangium siamense]GIG50182.1 hypothetical protein Dsi01nite_082230 [Dactylosporangium siamense]
MVTGAAPAALTGGLRLVLAALTLLLPRGFRDRQRAEWTADLMTMTTGRWRYLFGAARTLPALRAAARRAGLSRGPTAVAHTTGALRAPARVLLFGLGWPVLSWVLLVPLSYFLFDIPGRIARSGGGPVDPKSLWPDDGVLFWVLLPLMLTLWFGTYVALAGGWLLAATIGLAGAVVGFGGRRIWFAVAGLGLAAVALLAVTVAGFPMFNADPGYGAALLGTIAVGLGLFGRSLGRWQRGWLVVVGLAAVAVLAAHHTALGADMHAWFRD